MARSTRSGPRAHVARLRQSAARLCLPVPPAPLVAALIDLAIAENASLTPASPGALYLRPTLLGTDVTIGAAAHPSATAILYVLACPVGDYLPPGRLTVAVETVTPRTTPQFGVVKTGANYAMALAPIMAAPRAVRRRSGAVRAGWRGAGDRGVQRPAARRRRRRHAGAHRRLPPRGHPRLAAATGGQPRLAGHRARADGGRLRRVDGPPRRRGRPHRDGGRRRRRRHAGRRRRGASCRRHRHQPAHRRAAAPLLDIQAGRTTFDW